MECAFLLYADISQVDFGQVKNTCWPADSHQKVSSKKNPKMATQKRSKVDGTQCLKFHIATG